MEIDRDFLSDLLRDLKFVQKYLLDIKKLGVPVFTQAMLLNLRIVELEEILGM